MSLHACTSQYFLQFVKCDRVTCCGPMRTSWKKVFPNGFLPPPSLIRKNENGPSIPSPFDVKATDHFAGLWKTLAMKNMDPLDGPYDRFCPSLQKVISNRICEHCGVYFTNAAAVHRHRKSCPSLVGIPIPIPEFIELDEELSNESMDFRDEIRIININDILSSPFIELEAGEDSDE